MTFDIFSTFSSIRRFPGFGIPISISLLMFYIIMMKPEATRNPVERERVSHALPVRCQKRCLSEVDIVVGTIRRTIGIIRRNNFNYLDTIVQIRIIDDVVLTPLLDTHPRPPHNP